MKDQEPFLPTQENHALTGYRSKKGPDNPYRIQSPETQELVSYLGKSVEKAAQITWTGNTPFTDRQILKVSMAKVIAGVGLPRNELFRYHPELATWYQKLTLPAILPFNGNERDYPTDPDLRFLFSTVDSLWGTKIQKIFSEMDPVSSEEEAEKIIVSGNIRHLVEASLVLGKLALGYKPKFPGRFIPNVWVSNHCQFDGILVPESYNTEDFNFLEFIGSGLPYVVCEIKFPCRARYVTGPITKPSARDVRDFQNKLKEILVNEVDVPFYFPNYFHLIYLRGTKASVNHIVNFDYSFFRTWENLLELRMERDGQSIDNNHAKALAEYLEKRRVTIAEENDAKKQEAVENLKKMEDSYEQKSLF